MKHKVFILTIVLSFSLAFSASAAQNLLTRIDSFVTSGVAASGNLVLFGDSIGNFFAVDRQTGGTRWSYKDSDATVIGIPAIADGNVIIAKSTGEIICLKLSDGSVAWKYTPASSESVNEGLDDGVTAGGGKVYAAFTTGELKAFDLKTGKISWTYNAEQGLRTAPVYSGGLVLLGEYNGLFSMIDAKTGKRVNGGGAGGAINTPAVNNGNVYYSAWDGSVHAVKIKDVIPLWDANVKEPINTAPVVNEGIIAVETASGKIFALDEKSGEILWEFASNGGEKATRPVISGGKVFAGTGDNRVLVLNAKSGRLINEISNAYAVNSSEGKVLYFINENSELYELE